MKAIVYTAPETVEVRDIPIPEPEAGEYLVKVVANGICGSDVEGFLGKSGRRIPPVILGHEFSGVVEKAPVNAKYPKGTHVTAFPKYYCGECEICRKGLVNTCPGAPCLGVLDFNGSMTEYLAIPERYIMPLDGSLDFVTATLIEPFAVALRGAMNIPKSVLDSAESLLVIGAGTIGLLLVQAIRIRGFEGRIVVNDRSSHRLDLALELGANDVFKGDDFDAEVSALTDGRKFDIAVECVGLAVTARASLNALRNAGTAVWIGNNQKMIDIDMQQIVTSELKVIGSYTYSLENFTEALRLVEEGAVETEGIVSSVMGLDQGPEAFEKLKNNPEGKELKVVLTNKDL